MLRASVTGERRAKGRKAETARTKGRAERRTEEVVCLRRIVAFNHEIHMATSQAWYLVSSSSECVWLRRSASAFFDSAREFGQFMSCRARVRLSLGREGPAACTRDRRPRDERVWRHALVMLCRGEICRRGGEAAHAQSPCQSQSYLRELRGDAQRLEV